MNTLIRPSQQLGSDKWAWHTVQEIMATGSSKEDAIEKTERIWAKIHQRSMVQPVEESTPYLIEQLQKRGIFVIALTSRDHRTVSLTERQLQSVGIDFTKTALIKKEEPLYLAKDAVYINGILYVGKQQAKPNDAGLLALPCRHLSLFPTLCR